MLRTALYLAFRCGAAPAVTQMTPNETVQVLLPEPDRVAVPLGPESDMRENSRLRQVINPAPRDT